MKTEGKKFEASCRLSSVIDFFFKSRSMLLKILNTLNEENIIPQLQTLKKHSYFIFILKYISFGNFV